MRGLVTALIYTLLPLPAQGEPVSAAVVLALDYSSSLSAPERLWQIEGLAAVFADPAIEERIQATERDAVAVTVFRFAGAAEAPFIPWMVLRAGDGSVQRFQLLLVAEAGIARNYAPALDGTNIAAALLAAGVLLAEWPDADRLVVDIQTDGTQAEAPTSVPAALTLEAARDVLGMQSITINVILVGTATSLAGPTLAEYHYAHTANGVVWDGRDGASYLAALTDKINFEMW